MSAPANAKLNEDSFITFLAKCQIWLSENWKWLVILILVAIGSALITEKRRKDGIAKERTYWDNAAKASTIEQRQKFIKSNSETQAAKLLSLQLTRQLLDEGKFKEALTTVTGFISKNPDSPMVSIALMLQAYAHEELNENDKALESYKKVDAAGDLMSVLSKQFSERLEKSTAQ